MKIVKNSEKIVGRCMRKNRAEEQKKSRKSRRKAEKQQKSSRKAEL
jgi:hypothetical protein